MKTEAEIIKMRDEAEAHYNRRRGRSDLWAKMRLLNEILEEDYPGETRRMAKVKREEAEEDLAAKKAHGTHADNILVTGGGREGMTYRAVDLASETIEVEITEEGMANMKKAGYIVLSGADREGYRQIAEAAKKGRELFENTELAQSSPEYVPVNEGILAKKYREIKKGLDAR